MSSEPSRLFIITGASRGIGHSIALNLSVSKIFMSGKTHFMLTSTKLSDLEITKKEIAESVYSNNITVEMKAFDFSDVENLGQNIDSLLVHEDSWDNVTLIMNHGTLGGLDLVQDISLDLKNVCELCQEK